VTTLIFHQNQRKCAISSTNVAILLLLFKRAIILHNKLIDSQHYKRYKETTTREFHSLSPFTLTTTNFVQALISQLLLRDVCIMAMINHALNMRKPVLSLTKLWPFIGIFELSLKRVY